MRITCSRCRRSLPCPSRPLRCCHSRAGFLRKRAPRSFPARSARQAMAAPIPSCLRRRPASFAHRQSFTCGNRLVQCPAVLMQMVQDLADVHFCLSLETVNFGLSSPRVPAIVAWRSLSVETPQFRMQSLAPITVFQHDYTQPFPRLATQSRHQRATKSHGEEAVTLNREP